MGLNDRIIEINSASLDKFYAQQQVAAENLVNINTPGYKKKTVEISSDFLNEIKNAEDLLNGKYNKKCDIKIGIKQENNFSMQRDGNNVNIDEESINATKAQLGYKCAEICINSRFSILGTVINAK